MDNPTKFVPLGQSRLPGHPPESPPSAPEAAPGISLEERVLAVLKTCYDPELPVNIHELGLIYDLIVEPTGEVLIRMTLTSPGCPVAGSLVQEVQSKIAGIPGVTSARVELVWDPPWDRSCPADAWFVLKAKKLLRTILPGG
jgi:metal-sulfur cluster biosynthetic enzyme